MGFHRSVHVTLLCGACICRCVAPEDGVVLVRAGRPWAEICLPPAVGPGTRLAADELRHYVERITGARLPVRERTDTEATRRVALLPTLRPGGKTTDDDDTFTIETEGETLLIRGNSDTAVLYGVYQLLHELGVRWFTPGAIGENVPRLSTICIRPRKTQHRPSFRQREVSFSGYMKWHFDEADLERQVHEYDLWRIRNRLHVIARPPRIGPALKHKVSLCRERFHGTVRWALVGVDHKKEPERFALVYENGERFRYFGDRVKGHGAQICLSNAKNIAATIGLAVRHFTNRPDQTTYPLSLQDTSRVCECPGCIKANGGVSPRYDINRVAWSFMNAVAKGLRQRMPTKRICFHAHYGPMTAPPAGAQAEPGIVNTTVTHECSHHTEINDPDCPYNRHFMACVERIRAKGTELAAYEYLLTAGKPNPLAILNNIKLFHELGYVWFYAEWMGRDELRYMIAWIMAQLFWDASQDPRTLLEDYCRGYYGAASDEALTVVGLIEDRVREQRVIRNGSFSDSIRIMTPRVVEAGRKALAAGLGKVDGREKGRLTRLRDTFEMLARYARVARTCYRAMDVRTEAGRRAALAEVTAFQTFWAERKLSRTCSPIIVGDNRYIGVGHWEKALRSMLLVVEPQRHRHLVGADRHALIVEAFGGCPPENTDAVLLLPEIWKFRLDLKEEGEAFGWMAPDFADSTWHDQSTYGLFLRQGFPKYDGKYWYRVSFDCPTSPPGKRVLLRVARLNREDDIYLNGELVHRHRYLRWSDSQSFAVDVTASIRQGRANRLAVAGWAGFFDGISRPWALYDP